MRFILMAFAAAGFIGSTTTFGLADKVSSEEAEKIKAGLVRSFWLHWRRDGEGGRGQHLALRSR
jgi:hypothetical protein